MQKYKTLKRRIGAAIIDFLILLPVTLISLPVFEAGEKDLYKAFFIQVTAMAMSVAYFILMHTYFGRTLGKILLRVRVVDLSERPISFLQAFLRSLPQMVPLVLLISFSNPQVLSGTASPVDMFFAQSVVQIINTALIIFQILNIAFWLFNDKHRALHDFIAGTVVIRED